MIKLEVKKRIEKLRKEINKHRYNYHVYDLETISPAALDSLKNELFKLENQYPDLITPDSPTQRVSGKALDKFEKVKHRHRMISLFDAFSQEDMRDWEERNYNYLNKKINFVYYSEFKLDGLAVSVRYKKGVLILGVTRGDGRVGENVTNNIKTIESIPLQLRIPKEIELKKIGFNNKEIKELIKVIQEGEIEVRGEAVMPKHVFIELNKKYKAEGRPQLANTRNGAAGSLRQLDAKVAAERKLDFYAYDLIIEGYEPGELVKTREQANNLVNLLGFKTIKYNRICCNLDEVFEYYKLAGRKRNSLPFEVDGVVVKINDLKMWEVLGMVGKGPRYMMAYKFPAEQVTTKVLDVVWQVGRTGVLTPTAILEPVEVGGAIISRSTLHNLDEIKRLGIKIGDTVIIERSGDVIPKIVQVLKDLREGKEKSISIPKVCPRCGGEVKREEGEVAFRCLNKNCYAVNLRKIIHFVSKDAVDMAGLGDKLIEQFMSIGLISDAADLYSLQFSDLISLEGFAEKKAKNIIEIIQNKKRISLNRFIYALGIRYVGQETAQILSNIIKIKNKDRISIKELIKSFQSLSLEYLQSLNDIGPIVAQSIYDYWYDDNNLRLLDKFAKQGISLYLSQSSSHALEGKSFLFTGTLNGLTRAEAKDRIKDRGGKVKSSVSKDLDYLVIGDNPGSKYEQAKALGIKIINEKEFKSLLE